MKNEGIEKIMSGMKQCTESFTKSQKQLHEAISNPDTSKVQSAIDSKREMDKQERLEELELLNKNLIKQIKFLNKWSTTKTIISGAIGCIVGGIFMYYFPIILNWISNS